MNASTLPNVRIFGFLFLLFVICVPSLQAEEEIGLMLPCNIIVYVNDANETVISAINPLASMQAVQNPALGGFAVEVQGKTGCQ